MTVTQQIELAMQDAAEYANAAAKSSGTVIRELAEASEMVEVSSLLAEVWGLELGNSHIPPGMLVALAHAGNYVSGAFKDGELVGASVGFFHEPAAKALHSHITGVRREHAVAGVGTRSSCTSEPGALRAESQP